MRVVHVIESVNPSYGGPSTVVTRLSASQKRLGIPSKIFCYGSDSELLQLESSLQKVPGYSAEDINVYKRGKGLDKIFANHIYRSFLEELASDDVLVHIHGLWQPILVAAIRAAWTKDIPYVLSPHGMLAPWSLHQKSFKKRIALNLFWGKAIQRASMVHALNGDELSQVSRFTTSDKIRTIPNGIFLEELAEAGSHSLSFLYAQAPQLANRRIILFLGRLHVVKGLDYLAKAFREVAKTVSDADLVVVGPDAGAGEDFRRLLSDFGIGERVHILGPLYGSEKYALMKAAYCLCQPSRQEGFSLTITEAMACGTPVVISEECHFPEVEQAGAGRVVALDPHAIVDSLLFYLENKAQRDAAGANAQQLVSSRYTWDSVAREFIKVYESLT